MEKISSQSSLNQEWVIRETESNCGIRVSIGGTTSITELEKFVSVWSSFKKNIINRKRSIGKIMSEIKLEAKEGIDQDTIKSVKLLGEKYKYGFSTDIDMDYAPKGLSEEIVKLISEKIQNQLGCLIGG